MIKLILRIFMLFSFTLLSQEKMDAEKIIQINAQVTRVVLLDKDNVYRMELRGLAAIYHSTKEFLPCLEFSIKENKKVLLSVSAYSLWVKSCKPD